MSRKPLPGQKSFPFELLENFVFERSEDYGWIEVQRPPNYGSLPGPAVRGECGNRDAIRRGEGDRAPFEGIEGDPSS